MKVYFIKNDYGNEYNVIAENIKEAIKKYEHEIENDGNDYIDVQITEIKLIIVGVIL